DALDPTTVADYISWSDGSGMLIAALFAVGMITSLVTLAGIVYFSSSMVVRQSAFYVGLVMQVCIIITYFDLILMVGKPTTQDCMGDSFIIPLTFTLYYALVLTKTFRIYRLFTAATKIKHWTDFKVIGQSCVWLIPTIIGIAVWNSVGSIQPVVVKYSFGEYYWSCSSTSTNVQTAIVAYIMAYDGLILFLNLIMAFNTRNVLSKYNETKLIAISIYNMSMVLIFCLAILFSNLGFRLKVTIKAISLFYVLMFNTISSFSIKIYQGYHSKSDSTSVASANRDSEALDSETRPSAKHNPDLPTSEVSLQQTYPYSLNVLQGSSLVTLQAESPGTVWLCQSTLKTLESKKTKQDCLGRCWILANTSFFDFTVQEKEQVLVVEIDKFKFRLAFAVADDFKVQQWCLRHRIGKNTLQSGKTRARKRPNNLDPGFLDQPSMPPDQSAARPDGAYGTNKWTSASINVFGLCARRIMSESRNELLAWYNDLSQSNYTKVEQFGSGAAHCLILDSIFRDV
ncbi:hypothetical protein HDU91_000578, partial [Kappamyces sp. JEL0680]